MEEKKINHQIEVTDLSSGETTDTWANFKEKLESVETFPGLYAFKFVIPGDEAKLPAIQEVLPDADFSKQASKTGKYVSITVKKWMQDADAVIDIYKKVGAIDGVMML
jgi:putative lipoic acid-binding regulatory protein